MSHWRIVRKVIFSSLAALFLGALTNTAFACSCVGMPQEVQFRMTPTVFVGEISAVKHNVNQSSTAQGLLIGPGTIEVTFKIKRAIKGEGKVDDSIVIRTSDQESACGIVAWARESPGSVWIVYADRSSGVLTSGLCSPTKRADSPAAAEDFKYFDALK